MARLVGLALAYCRRDQLDDVIERRRLERRLATIQALRPAGRRWRTTEERLTELIHVLKGGFREPVR